MTTEFSKEYKKARDKRLSRTAVIKAKDKLDKKRIQRPFRLKDHRDYLTVKHGIEI